MKRHIFIGIFLLSNLFGWTNTELARKKTVYGGPLYSYQEEKVISQKPIQNTSLENNCRKVKECNPFSYKDYGVIFLGMGALAALIRVVN